MAVAAGARRTDTALARFEAASNVPDVFVVKFDTTSPLDLEQVARLPEVAVSARAVQPIFHGRLESGRLVGTTDFGISGARRRRLQSCARHNHHHLRAWTLDLPPGGTR